MSAATAHAPAATPKEEYFRYTNLGPILFGLPVAAGIGLLVCILGAAFSHDGLKQFLFSWLFAFMFFFTIAMGALFWTMLHYAVDAEWSVVVRRILEMMANSFTVIWIAFLPIMIWAHRIYDWMNVPFGVDPPLDNKRALLNPTYLGVDDGHHLLVLLRVELHAALALDPAGRHGRPRLHDPGAQGVVRVHPAVRHPADGGGHLLGDEHFLPLVLDHVGRLHLRRERVELDGDAHHHHATCSRTRAT